MKNKELMFYLIISFHFLFYACNSKQSDDFYKNNCGDDCKRIPLLKPYFIASTTGIDGFWYIDNGNEAHEIISVCVVDSIILSYYFNKNITKIENRDTIWYIHIPSKTEEYIYSSKSEFYKHVKKITDKQVDFIEPRLLYKQLLKIGYLNWFPEDYKNRKK